MRNECDTENNKNMSEPNIPSIATARAAQAIGSRVVLASTLAKTSLNRTLALDFEQWSSAIFEITSPERKF